MKAIVDFVAKFGTKIPLNTDFVVKKDGRYFLLNGILKRFIRDDYYYAGTYLGKMKDGIFFPSFNLLAWIGRRRANSVVIDRKASWLFICGRDIFRKSILSVNVSPGKNDYVLVLNEFKECLGFGRIVSSLNAAGKGADPAVRNISDIGDFLRRETR